MLFPEIRRVILMPRLELVLRGIADFGFGALVRTRTLPRFGRGAIRQAARPGTARWMRRAPRAHDRACFVYRGGAAPMTGFASLRDTSRRCGGRYRCPIRAIVSRWGRPAGSHRGPRGGSVA